ncbi:hypothetical protein [Streptomyces chartreusis]|uniref:hypothetical protein n=1 Tax=Streptomyces chartreusis TaxID=1969 RepID=UPI0037B4A909
MGAGLLFYIGVPLFFYLILVTILCVKIGDKTTWRMGWLMAAGLVFLPLGAFIVLLIP